MIPATTGKAQDARARNAFGELAQNHGWSLALLVCYLYNSFAHVGNILSQSLLFCNCLDLLYICRQVLEQDRFLRAGLHVTHYDSVIQDLSLAQYQTIGDA